VTSFDRDGLISRQEFINFYAKILENSDDSEFEKGIDRFYTSAKIVTVDKINGLQNDKLEVSSTPSSLSLETLETLETLGTLGTLETLESQAGLNQFKMFFKRMQNANDSKVIRIWSTNLYLDLDLDLDFVGDSDMDHKREASTRPGQDR